MPARLNVRKLITEEFKKEFRRINGRQPLDQAVIGLRSLFDLRDIQSKVDDAISEKKDEKDQNVLRKYHRNNLRYLTKYFAEILTNQLKSSKISLREGLKDQKLIGTIVKTFKNNPQCKVYH